MSYDFIYVICKVGHLFLFFCFFVMRAQSVKNGRQQRPLGFAASLVEELRQQLKHKKEFLPCKRAELERSELSLKWKTTETTKTTIKTQKRIV